MGEKCVRIYTFSCTLSFKKISSQRGRKVENVSLCRVLLFTQNNVVNRQLFCLSATLLVSLTHIMFMNNMSVINSISSQLNNTTTLPVSVETKQFSA